tara:strand:- start:1044 stop:1394 length:351 start_codon:yes stop_codon:yes gene_type:complete
VEHQEETFRFVVAPQHVPIVDMLPHVLVVVINLGYPQVVLLEDHVAAVLRLDLQVLESKGEGILESLPLQFVQNDLQVVRAQEPVVVRNDQEDQAQEALQRISAVEEEDPNHEITT